MKHVNGKMSPIIRGVFDPQIILMYLQTAKSGWGVQACKCTRVKTSERKIGLHVPTRYIHTSGIHATAVLIRLGKLNHNHKLGIKCTTWEADYILAWICQDWATSYYCHHIDQWLANKTSKPLPNKHSSSWQILLSSCASMISLPFLRTNEVLGENPPAFMLTRCKIWWLA